jgi:hypothetical protein
MTNHLSELLTANLNDLYLIQRKFLFVVFIHNLPFRVSYEIIHLYFD